MTSRRTRFLHLLPAVALAALAGCGGGGGGSSDGGGGDTIAPAVVITADNAPAVAAQAIDAGSTGFVGDSIGLTGVQAQADGRGAAIATGWRAAAKALRGVRAIPQLVGVQIDATVNCPGGGTLSITGDVASEAALSIGDSVTLAFSRCVAEGGRVDGTLSFTVTAVNGDDTLLGATATARDFSATAFGITERVDGALSLRIDETDPALSVLRVTSTRLDFDRIVAGRVRASRTLFDYDYRGVTTVSTGVTDERLSFVASGTFRVIGEASFTVETLQPVSTPSGAEHPSAGVLRVTGAEGGTLTATVIADGLRIEVDDDGDGSIDTTLVRTWVDLDAAL